MIKNTVLSLVLASSMSVSAFADSVKSNIPEISFSKLKQQSASIKKQSSSKMTDQQLSDFTKQLDVMKRVNLTTETDFIPALDANLQRWAKEDIAVLKYAVDYIKTALKSRQSQYDNLALVAKQLKAPKEIVEQIQELKKMTADTQEKVKEFNARIHAIEEANILVSEASKIIKIDDFWIPALAGNKNNALIVKTSAIAENDFDKLAEVEDQLIVSLSSTIKKSEYYSSISLAS
jgi:hypothetical protein